MMNKTYQAKEAEVVRKCYIIDAKDKVLGRVAAKVATVLRGKHKAVYTPHVDTGDMVIVINAEHVKLTGNKSKQKAYQRYSGFPSGQRIVNFSDMIKRKPETVIELAVRRMIPSGALGSKVNRKLRIYRNEKHNHQAQKPVPLEI